MKPFSRFTEYRESGTTTTRRKYRTGDSFFQVSLKKKKLWYENQNCLVKPPPKWRSIDRSIDHREREYNRGLIYCKFSQLKPTIKLLYILYINNKRGEIRRIANSNIMFNSVSPQLNTRSVGSKVNNSARLTVKINKKNVPMCTKLTKLKASIIITYLYIILRSFKRRSLMHFP